MNPIDLNDPRLTLYALHEMEPREQAEFEQLLAQDAAAREAVEEIRATVTTVTAALEHEPVEVIPPVKAPGKLLRFPQLYYMISGLAAACFAVFFVLWQNGYKEKPVTHLIEVPLAPLAADEEAKKASEAGAAALPALRAAESRSEGLVAQAKDDYSHQKERDQNQVTVDLPVVAAPAPAPNEVVALDKFQVMADDRNAPSATAMSNGTAAPSSLRVAGGTNFGGKPMMKSAWAARQEPATLGTVSTGREKGNTEAYAYRQDNDYRRVADEPLSTFSIDVDTASYANVRRFLLQGRLPPVDAVRTEELVNYFPYHYAPPAGEAPFAVSLEAAGAPWNPAHRLVRIGLKGREVVAAQRPAANLVFLLDVSGSMNEPNKLPLVKQSLRLLVNQLRADDRVAIAVYAGASGLALPSTSAAHKARILDAIDALEAAGSTNGEQGIQLAYDIAKANFVSGGVNRVILATDGDFNVGVTSEGDLVRLVQEKAKSGVFLSVLGFGMGNIKDSTLEQLADKGNGNYAYIDSPAEARKSLVEEAGGTLQTIAKDVKIQVEFNPAVVAAYRLIGYENRLLAKEDFNNDQVDAGDIGAGHTVTALYEVVPAGTPQPTETPGVDALKYQRPANGAPATPPSKARGEVTAAPLSQEMLTVSIRYKEPAGDVSSRLEFPLRDTGETFASASPDFKFAAAVAAFGMVLRDSPHKGTSTWDDVKAWGRAGLADDAGGYRSEFISLVERAATIQ